MLLRALTWNVFHGRDFPPDPALRSRRSRYLRITERNDTHVQVNRDLRSEFVSLLAATPWDFALLQECPPRWEGPLADASGAQTHRVLTSRNSFAALRALGARLNPDLIGANEGGSNLTLVRPGEVGGIAERRELVLCPGPRPERRVLGFTRLANGVCVANLHATTGPALRARAEAELRHAAEQCLHWADGAPLVLGGDLNVRPQHSPIYDELAERFDLRGPTGAASLDHLLVHDLEIVEGAEPWPAERREVRQPSGLLVRLSDHAPVTATFGR